MTPRFLRAVPSQPPTVLRPDPTINGSLLAAAAQLSTAKIRRGRPLVQQESWQHELWDLYDTVGEFQYAQNWIAQACSRAELTVEQRMADSDKPVDVTDGPARLILDEVLDGCGGEGQFLDRSSLQVGTVGVTVLVGMNRVSEVTGQVVGYDWMLADVSEFGSDTSGLTIADPFTGEPFRVPDDAFVVKFWKRDPRRAHLPHSSARSAIPILRELEGLSKHVAASVDSRLAGNGILFLPSEMTMQAPDGAEISSEEVMAGLVAAMTAPIADRDLASAVVPVIARAAADHIAAVKYMTFSTPFDANATAMRENALRRLAISLNLPPEQLLGIGTSTNHWNGYLIEESGVKTNIEPLLTVITSGLTTQVLRPLLERMGVPNPNTFRVVARTDRLILRPNRVADSKMLWDEGLISADARRQTTGFDAGDAPTDAEMTDRLVRMLAQTGRLDVPGDITVDGVRLVPYGRVSQVAPQGPPQTAPAAPTGEPDAPSNDGGGVPSTVDNAPQGAS